MNFMSDKISTLIKGAVDCHIHGSPDVTQRIASDLQIAKDANNAGMKAILVKSHVTPTTARASLVQEAVGTTFRVFGGLTLNKHIGGLNVQAVETELRLGAKEIWMPTLSAVNQARLHNQDSQHAVAIFDEQGKPLSQLIDILDLIAKHDAILGTGHISAEESEKLFLIARERKVQKILITHPESRLIKMPLEMQKRLAGQGAFFERCFYQFAIKPPANSAPEELLEQIKATGVERSIIATDFGQIFNDPPVAGLRKCIQMLFDLKVSINNIETMVKKNPSELFDC